MNSTPVSPQVNVLAVEHINKVVNVTTRSLLTRKDMSGSRIMNMNSATKMRDHNEPN